VFSKYGCRISVLLGQFENFELSNLPIVKVKKSQYRRYLMLSVAPIREKVNKNDIIQRAG
jgi:hypothetical protein